MKWTRQGQTDIDQNIVDERGRIIAMVCIKDIARYERIPHANLLAAAPDMLEALKVTGCGCGCPDHEGGYHTNACDLRRAAIAKAEGQL